MCVQAAEPQRVGLEVDHPRVVARLGEQPAAPARSAADVDEPPPFGHRAELVDEVDDVDEPGRAAAQVLEVLLDAGGRALPEALLLHRLLHPLRLALVEAHEDDAVAHRVEELRGGRPQAVVALLERAERLLTAQRFDDGGGESGGSHGRDGYRTTAPAGPPPCRRPLRRRGSSAGRRPSAASIRRLRTRRSRAGGRSRRRAAPPDVAATISSTLTFASKSLGSRDHRTGDHRRRRTNASAAPLKMP